MTTIEQYTHSVDSPLRDSDMDGSPPGEQCFGDSGLSSRVPENHNAIHRVNQKEVIRGGIPRDDLFLSPSHSLGRALSIL